jgi:hypothetical protein
MKKSLLTLAIIGAVASLSAQITVNSTYIAGLGDTFLLSEDTINGPSLDLGTAAGNQIWDFSSLVEHDPDGGIFQDPSTAPLSSNFPNATFVLNDLNGDSIHLFFNSTSTALDIVGIVEYDSLGNPVLGDITGEWRFMQFPSTMGSTWTSNPLNQTQTQFFGIDFDSIGPHPYIDSLRTKIAFNFVNEIDAWGEMQLPQGSYLSIRQKSYNTIRSSGDCYYDGAWHPYTAFMLALIDSVNFDTADEATYRWWSDNASANLFVVELEADSNGMASTVSFAKADPAWVQGVDAVSQIQFTLYPNPTTDYLTIETDYAENWSYVLYDINAKQVMTEKAAGSVQTINTGSIASGTYLLHAIDKDGRTIKLEKVQIQH